jgi:DNA-binding PadR family transcriptional regulator
MWRPWFGGRHGPWWKARMYAGGGDEPEGEMHHGGHHGPPGHHHEGGPPEFVRHMHFRHGGRGPWRFGFGFDPRGPHGGPRVGRGDVRAATLLLLAEQPLHGYQIIQEITERSHGIWQPSPGSVYPALQLLEDEGLVRAEQTEGRRVYYLTDSGRAYVEAHRAELAAARDAVTGGVSADALELRETFGQVAAAFGQVVHAGTPAQVAAAKELLTNTRRQLYRILADDSAAPGPEHL